MDLVAYYRVSTQRQGQSGLGLEAQRARVAELARARGSQVVAEYEEVESGRKADRPKLAEALEDARKRRAAVVVAKLDRLARDAEFVLRLSREAEANGLAGFLFCDLPDVDATTSAGRLILSVMASVAEFESRRISERTRDALAAAKAAGRPLGNNLPKQAAATRERVEEAQRKAEALAGIVRPMRQQGMSMQAIAKALTSSGQPTPSGKVGEWSVMAVKRLLARLELT
jgi:DNA invertase Pin-like site-specific DNA recombinase